MGSWRWEACTVDLGADRLTARGTQAGQDPLPYRADYELETDAGWRTRRLHVRSEGEGWSRTLTLTSDGAGRWACRTGEAGDVDLPPPGLDPGTVAGALDCDLAFSPLTNTMPVLRHDLHRRPGAHDLLMAWVRLPGLSVHPSEQRYEHVEADSDGAVVRYGGRHRDFVGLLRFDRDGLVVHYPELAERVSPPA